MYRPRFRTLALAAALGLITPVSGIALPAPVAAAAPYGPDTCKSGYVWREAIPSDHVCAEPWVRDQVGYDNSQAVARRDPTGPYGSNSCISGYVWREAFAGDLVCVEPWMRDQAHFDNSQAADRVAAN